MVHTFPPCGGRLGWGGGRSILPPVCLSEPRRACVDPHRQANHSHKTELLLIWLTLALGMGTIWVETIFCGG